MEIGALQSESLSRRRVITLGLCQGLAQEGLNLGSLLQGAAATKMASYLVVRSHQCADVFPADEET